MAIKEFFKQLYRHRTAKYLLGLLALLVVLGIYAPVFSSSKPFAVCYQKKWYFPFFKYLFYQGLYTKKVDIFYNLFMLVLPICLFATWSLKKHYKVVCLCFALIQATGFYYFTHASDSDFILGSKSSIKALAYVQLESHLKNNQYDEVSFCLNPIGIGHHWQENALIHSSKLSSIRVNGQSLWASLFFGIRYSLTIALSATFIAFVIGITIGSLAGYFGKKIDLLIGRWIELWESIPALFIILLLVSSTEKSSMVWMIIALSLFSWTSIARIVRLEVLKQKTLPYVDVLKGFGYTPKDILLKHVLPQLSCTLISLIPFALIGAITYEAALSFLGLGDRQNCSIGLLIDEARMTYPMQPELFWPPAIFLIIILVSLAWLGDLSKKILQPRDFAI
ncbi:MAG: hypothetical protein S4CHLAM6_15930 [Chlamydiae bacterium]|nr:hypothetical protein [Chlamydiota bacterium]